MKNIFKKLISAAVCLTIAFSAAGCSSSKNEISSSSAAVSSTEAVSSSSENDSSFPYTFTPAPASSATARRSLTNFSISCRITQSPICSYQSGMGQQNAGKSAENTK